MIVVPFIREHLSIDVHDEMSFIKPYLKNENYVTLLENSISYSAIYDGTVIACAGMLNVGKHRWVAWALLSKDSGKHMLKITREVKKFFDNNPVDRLEIDVRNDFEKGHRWAKMLGFKNETPDGRDFWGEDGKNYALYARVK